jgi:hypothetical protein
MSLCRDDELTYLRSSPDIRGKEVIGIMVIDDADLPKSTE